MSIDEEGYGMTASQVAAYRAARSEKWPERWDYKRISKGSPHMIAHATGPQHSCIGVSLDGSDILQPDKPTMQKVFTDARKIASVPALIDNLTTCVMQLRKVCEERDLMSDSDAAVIKSADDLLGALSSTMGTKS